MASTSIPIPISISISISAAMDTCGLLLSRGFPSYYRHSHLHPSSSSSSSFSSSSFTLAFAGMAERSSGEAFKGAPRRIGKLRSSVENISLAQNVNVTANGQASDEDDDRSFQKALSISTLKQPVAMLSDSIEDGEGRLPINLDLSLYRAKCLYRKNANKDAEVILRQCIKDWPLDGRPYVVLGRQLMKQGQFKEARALLEDGCQAVGGENSYIWQVWAILEKKSGNISKSRKLFDAAIAADVRHAAAWHGWAVLELGQGNTKKARELLLKGIKNCSPNEYLFQTMGIIEYKAGRINEARFFFSQATACNPNSCASWLAHALIEVEQGRFGKARSLFQKALKASPKNRYTWQAWAIFEAEQANEEQARKLFQRGHELNPRDAVLLQAFALFEFKYSNPDTAREIFRTAAALDPNHQPIWIAWGWMESREGNLDTARDLYKKSLAVNSTNMDAARTFQGWGILEARDGNYAEARDLFKCALRVDSQNKAAWMSWALLEEDLGNTGRADEIRDLYLQQRTEVVDEIPWDFQLSNMLAPTIDRIKDLLKLGKRNKLEPLMAETSPTLLMENESVGDLAGDDTSDDLEFNVELFVKEKFPKRYGQIKNVVQEKTVIE